MLFVYVDVYHDRVCTCMCGAVIVEFNRTLIPCKTEFR